MRAGAGRRPRVLAVATGIVWALLDSSRISLACEGAGWLLLICQEEQPSGAPEESSIIVLLRADGQILDAVGIEVSDEG